MDFNPFGSLNESKKTAIHILPLDNQIAEVRLKKKWYFAKKILNHAKLSNKNHHLRKTN